jgi:uncharacterized protein (DUF433 family)
MGEGQRVATCVDGPREGPSGLGSPKGLESPTPRALLFIAGTGVTVRTIVGHYKVGLTPEETADEMGLELASVYAALAYYHLHQDEIEADILANSEEAVIQEFGTSPRA